MSIFGLLNAAFRRLEEGSSQIFQPRSSLSRITQVIVLRCEVDVEFKRLFISHALAHGYLVLNDIIIVKHLPRPLLGRLISDVKLRCDEATVIRAIDIKYGQWTTAIPSEGDYPPRDPIEFFALLCCVCLRRLRPSDTHHDNSMNIFRGMATSFLNIGDVLCVNDPDQPMRGTMLEEEIQVIPRYTDLTSIGTHPGLIDMEYQEERSVCRISFGVAVRKMAVTLNFEAYVKNGSVLVNKKLTVIGHWLIDGEVHHLLSAASSEVWYDDESKRPYHGESIDMNLDHLELLPMKRYEFRASLQDITNIHDAILQIKTLDLLY